MTGQELTEQQFADKASVSAAITELDRVAGLLDIAGPTRQLAGELYRDASERNLLRGRSIEGVASACLYIACRKRERPRSLDEFEHVSQVDRNTLATTYRGIVAELDIEVEPVDPSHFVPRFCSTLGTSRELERRARSILTETRREGLHSGRSPTALAGGAIYIAGLLCNEHLTQAEIADVARVTTMTVRSRYQEQLAVVDISE